MDAGAEIAARAGAAGTVARPAGLWEVPELPVAFFSFLLHFVWEFVQVPTYTGMAAMAHWEAIKLCMSATFGDVGFALTAFWIASLAARSRDWIHQPERLPVGGLAATFRSGALLVATSSRVPRRARKLRLRRARRSRARKVRS